MLRPKDVFEWFKARAARNQNEIGQLLDGLLPNGMIVVGGAEQNVLRVLPTLSAQHRIGRVVSIVNAKLDPARPATFDTAAVVQLNMMARNENFHETIAMVMKLLEQANTDGMNLDAAIEILRVEAQKVPVL